MTSAGLRLAGLLLLLAFLLPGGSPARASAPVDEATVHDVSLQLRCVVCQNLSVADSPSEMARQMRGVVRERLAAGDSPDQVIQYFVARYGEWILLAPPARGFNLLVWGAPALATALGLASVTVLVRRWTRRRAPAATVPVDDAMAARIRQELERER